MKRLLLFAVAAALLFTTPVRAEQTTQAIDCSVYYGTVTLTPTNGDDVDITLSGGLYSGCLVVPEASDDGSTWVTVGVKKTVDGKPKSPYVYALTSSNTATQFTWRYLPGTGQNYFRLRVATFGSFGSRTVTLATH